MWIYLPNIFSTSNKYMIFLPEIHSGRSAPHVPSPDPPVTLFSSVCHPTPNPLSAHWSRRSSIDIVIVIVVVYRKQTLYIARLCLPLYIATRCMYTISVLVCECVCMHACMYVHTHHMYIYILGCVLVL